MRAVHHMFIKVKIVRLVFMTADMVLLFSML